MANNIIAKTKETITSIGVKESSAKINPKGSVLVAMIGQGKTRGQTAILDIDAATNQNVAAIRLFKNVLSDMVWYFFLSRYETTRSGASGGNQPALNGEKIKNTVLALPPIVEINEIIVRLNNVKVLLNKLDQQISKSQQDSELLMQAVLREAFET